MARRHSIIDNPPPLRAWALRGLLAAISLLGFTPLTAQADANIGLNTPGVLGQPGGIEELPIGVEGQVGLDLVNSSVTLPTNSIKNTTNPPNVVMLGQAAIGTSSFANSAALTVNGSVAVLGIQTSGWACPVAGLIAQDGSGHLLSCQSNSGGNPTSLIWGSAFGGASCSTYTYGNTVPVGEVIPGACYGKGAIYDSSQANGSVPSGQVLYTGSKITAGSCSTPSVCAAQGADGVCSSYSGNYSILFQCMNGQWVTAASGF